MAARAVSIPKVKSHEVAKLSTIVPATPVQATTTNTLLVIHDKELEPKWVCAEGFTRKEFEDAHLATMRIVMERSAEWNEQL